MKLNVSRLHHPVTALGPGIRAGLWVQGCTIGCPGCVSRDTWDHGDGTALEVDDVLAWLAGLGEVDGLTISGGEPTEQPAALHALLQGIERLRRDGHFAGDVLCYTGRDEAEFHAAFPWAADLIDAVIVGAFAITEPTDLLWRGSANQRLIPLTDLGRLRYGPFLDERAEHPPLQVTVEDGQVWMIGIPRRGDLRRLETALRSSGVELEEVSWRPR
ncbi:anaerobic ribonucleoside-triphosphate reductase activating protein [Mycolicibacterium rutilum]|uniref:Anaerobic ribonucleoside-triphosphate reductase activating protein n=1 Tax=Mycolicibacterium rutilum TaxID=370526 RepID=A0A1H6IIQ2_MYCRU|nr:4Fe-4S cluster-binding domain-containing protein [Mycolicibacterium rutilum]SEH46804.1 anaerobic ribonucleoside-triphosphate reductase activating protein [Mycolicibacterium rutilum]